MNDSCSAYVSIRAARETEALAAPNREHIEEEGEDTPPGLLCELTHVSGQVHTPTALPSGTHGDGD
jgi:hypothetical protein